MSTNNSKSLVDIMKEYQNYLIWGDGKLPSEYYTLGKINNNIEEEWKDKLSQLFEEKIKQIGDVREKISTARDESIPD